MAVIVVNALNTCSKKQKNSITFIQTLFHENDTQIRTIVFLYLFVQHT